MKDIPKCIVLYYYDVQYYLLIAIIYSYLYTDKP